MEADHNQQHLVQILSVLNAKGLELYLILAEEISNIENGEQLVKCDCKPSR